MTIVDQVASLRRRSRVPATQVARFAGTPAQNIYAIERGRRDPSASTLERIAAGNGVQLIAAKTDGRAPVTSTAAVLAAYVNEGNPDGAYRQLIQISDDLVAADPATAVVLAYAQPSLVAPGWDAAIAGVVEYRLSQKGAPLPRWVLETGGSDEPWEPLPSWYKIDPASVPEELRRRNVFIEAVELDSV